MTGTTTSSSTSASPTSSRSGSVLYSALAGVTGVVVLFQGLWAGLFIHEGEDYQENYVQVHDLGAKLSIVLALATLVVAVVKLRTRRDLIIGSAVFLVLLAAEGHIGSLIGDSPSATAVHFPLAMGLMGLAVWLPMRARRA